MFQSCVVFPVACPRRSRTGGQPGFRGAAGYFCVFVANKRTSAISTLASPRVFHWATQGFPLGHPTISLDDPSVWDPQRACFLACWGGRVWGPRTSRFWPCGAEASQPSPFASANRQRLECSATRIANQSRNSTMTASKLCPTSSTSSADPGPRTARCWRFGVVLRVSRVWWPIPALTRDRGPRTARCWQVGVVLRVSKVLRVPIVDL